MNHCFPKQERLCGKKETSSLMKSGKRILSGELVLIYTTPAPKKIQGIRVLVIAPKKNFPKAHQRNRIKRLMREVWRTSKNLFMDENTHPEFSMNLCFLARHKTIPDFETIQKEMHQGISLLKQKSR